MTEAAKDNKDVEMKDETKKDEPKKEEEPTDAFYGKNTLLVTMR